MRCKWSKRSVKAHMVMKKIAQEGSFQKGAMHLLRKKNRMKIRTNMRMKIRTNMRMKIRNKTKKIVRRFHLAESFLF